MKDHHHKKDDESPTIYMIRHGEKDPKLADGEDPIGLSTNGLKRSQALVQVFGPNSPYNIGYILAQHPKKSGKRQRPYDTVKPLADSLGPSGVEFNSDIDRDDADAVAKVCKHYKGPGNILICWEHKQLDDIAQAIGIKHIDPYPDDRFDVIWTVEAPYHELTSITSEHCPGLDDKYANDP